MGMRPALIAAFMAMCLFLSPAQAQTTRNGQAPAAAAEQADSPAAAPETGISLSHSALKAITYKIGTTVSNVTILSVATGSLVAGSALTAFVTTASLAIYTVNDYLWDKHVPPPAKTEQHHSFDLKDEFWRTTNKFATWTATILWVKAIKAASLYAYTGSSTTTVAAVAAGTLVAAGLFYANNFAWDYYDSLPGESPAAEPASPPAIPTAELPDLPRAAALPEPAPKS